MNPATQRRWFATFVLTLLVATAAPIGAQEPAADDSVVFTTPQFEFRSHLATNLNDALLEAGRNRNLDRPDLFAEGGAQACFDALPLSARRGWELAVEYYAEVIASSSWSSRQQTLLRLHLAGYDDQVAAGRDREFLKIAAGFWDAAVPAYRECRWAEQDASNRVLASRLQTLLAEHGAAIAERLPEIYGEPWGALPYQIDLVETVNWAGANSYFLRGGRGHILMSRETSQLAQMETTFHEASHGWMFGNHAIRRALAEAAQTQGVELPTNLWHVVLFMTTGEVVRSVLESAGVTDYRPVVYSIFDRGDWTELREPIERAWLPYLRGERSMEQAAADLVAALGGE
ncbi:MAG: hypothetical protein GKS06_20505 [Acidobacteria bacterium]|nr:hypothetical protein [Acidobacteriota bacterium]